MSEASTAAYPAPSKNHGGMGALILGAIGVVYGDIGTSPLYTLKEVFAGHLDLNAVNVLGILSLVFWSLFLTVSVKYVMIIMKADNRGEGGVLALSTLAKRGLGPKASTVVICLGMLGMALFTGDSIITPAISVLSAVEGLRVAAPSLDRYIIPVTLGVLIALFAIQSKGTGTVGKLFGPIMIAWFAILGFLGMAGVAGNPGVLRALSPTYALAFFSAHGFGAFFVLGSVVLAVTGGEALYADMGHFGRKAIQRAWLFFVMPCIAINYFGQGALLLADPEAAKNPFYLLVPAWGMWPMLILATAATVIASQAVISGAFSLTHQAIALGYLPRREIRHTSAAAEGQVYIPRTNWLLMAGVIILVIGFRTSDALASAYGISVVGAMTIDTLLASVVAVNMWRWKPVLALPLFAFLAVVDLTFLAANMVKIPEGGWFPIMIAIGAFSIMFIWRKGRRVVLEAIYGDAMPIRKFIETQLRRFQERTAGTAVFLTGDNGVVPHTLLHNIKHNRVLHDRILLMTVKTGDVSYEKPENRVRVEDLGHGFFMVELRYGYMEKPDIPSSLPALKAAGIDIDMMDTSFFLGRETLVAGHDRKGLNRLQEPIFIALSKTAGSATAFFHLPPNRVLELGTQVEV